MGPGFSYELIGDNGIARDGYEGKTKHIQLSDWYYDWKNLVARMNMSLSELTMWRLRGIE